jgi:hypothetical protein
MSKAGNGSVRSVIMDFDDLCDGNDRLDVLLRLKDRDPGFKVTLFAIPTRMSEPTLTKYEKEREWIELGIHGWRHARHECLGWTDEETQQKITLARCIYPHFAPIFKAPNWEICDDVYEGLKASGVAVSDHVRNIAIMPPDMPHYIYNLRLRDDIYTRMHGHIQSYNRTGLEEAYELWSSPPIGSTYHFVTEAVTARREVAV